MIIWVLVAYVGYRAELAAAVIRNNQLVVRQSQCRNGGA
jgi:hypothetical protein|tara:strand:- start:223 stop:339 length:117 start_codon:yes stop_codon:yes gene_type:complete